MMEDAASCLEKIPEADAWQKYAEVDTLGLRVERNIWQSETLLAEGEEKKDQDTEVGESQGDLGADDSPALDLNLAALIEARLHLH